MLTKQEFQNWFGSVERLYHYTSFESAVRILDSGYILFSDLCRMNDINESYRTVYWEITGDPVFPKDSFWTHYRQLSLTQDGSHDGYNIPSMWGHYADRGNGVCFVFDKNLLLTQAPNGKYFHHDEVDYDCEYNGDIMLSPGDYNSIHRQLWEDNIKDVFFIKTEDWEHEQEYRIIQYSKQITKFKSLQIGSSLIAVIMLYDQKKNQSIFGSYEDRMLHKVNPCLTLLELWRYIDGEYILKSRENKKYWPTDNCKWSLDSDYLKMQ